MFFFQERKSFEFSTNFVFLSLRLVGRARTGVIPQYEVKQIRIIHIFNKKK